MKAILKTLALVDDTFAKVSFNFQYHGRMNLDSCFIKDALRKRMQLGRHEITATGVVLKRKSLYATSSER